MSCMLAVWYSCPRMDSYVNETLNEERSAISTYRQSVALSFVDFRNQRENAILRYTQNILAQHNS